MTDTGTPLGDEKAQRRNEARMFLAADIRDELSEVSDLSYGDRNRVAWDTVDAVLPPGGEVSR